MNTKLNKTILCTLVFLCVSAFSSCKEKPDDPPKDTTLQISLSETSVIPNDGLSQFLRIETNSDKEWTINLFPDNSWVSVNRKTGTGSGSVIVTAQSNTQDGKRFATITVAIGELERSVELSQEAAVSVVYEVPFRLELPMVRDSSWYIQHDVGMYALEYDTAQRHAMWVAFVLNKELLATSGSERQNFTFDPKIPRTLQPHEVDYYGEIVIPRYWSTYRYERGHTIASADRRHSQAANDATNYMSNISPHLPEFHNTTGGTGSGGGVWMRLESLVRQWANSCDTLYIVKGGSIISGAPGTEIVEVLYNINRTVVPRYYYMALVQRRGDTFDGIAFWLRQEKGMERRAIARTDVITIRELEQKTGINFFHNLKYALPANPNLEEQVETSQPNWAWWSSL
jgi:endonuclease G